MVQTLPGDFIDVGGDRNTSADKKSRTNLWSTLSWAKVDPKRGYKLFLYVHDLNNTKQEIVVMGNRKNKGWQKNLRPHGVG